MATSTMYRRRSRGRPALGFQMEVPDALELHDGAVVTCREVRGDGRVVGELEIAVFAAALLIDRDGILAEKARATLGVRSAGDPIAVRLPGASGFRTEAVASTRLPYVYAFALAPSDLGVDGGLAITVRSARPDWPAAEQLLGSLRLLRRNGTVDDSADDEPAAPLLPFVARGA
ncbi:MAG TPA: hypothetical protein VFP84_31855 [Kofleriaceae bacterium]|nr:hypothetical protein [Kofleriaceae bacterium]